MDGSLGAREINCGAGAGADDICLAMRMAHALGEGRNPPQLLGQRHYWWPNGVGDMVAAAVDRNHRPTDVGSAVARSSLLATGPVGPILIQIGLSTLLCREHHLRAIQAPVTILDAVESKNLHLAHLLEPLLDGG